MRTENSFHCTSVLVAIYQIIHVKDIGGLVLSKALVNNYNESYQG